MRFLVILCGILVLPLSSAYADKTQGKPDSWCLAAITSLSDRSVNQFTPHLLNPMTCPQAVDLLKPLAQSGNVLAQRFLGDAYYYKGDYAAALKWVLKAANGGNAMAMEEMGDFYRNGRGVKKDQAEAQRWYHKQFEVYKRRAEQGDAETQFELANLYTSGHGVARNYTAAFKLFRHLAENRKGPYAYLRLGLMYQSGLGVKQDWQEAYFWLSLPHGGDPGVTWNGNEAKSHLTPQQIKAVDQRVNKWVAAQP